MQSEKLWFLRRRENREKKSLGSKQGKEPTTNSTHVW